MTDREKQLIVAQMTSAFTSFLDHRGVAVVGMKDGKPYEQGSGTCIEVGSRYFVATAAHVIKGLRDDDIWLIVSHGKQTSPVPIIGRGLRGGGRGDAVDIAWLELAAETALAIPTEFVPLRQLRSGVGRVVDDGAYVHGYPSARSLVSPELLSVQPIGFLTMSTWDESGDEATDIFLEYPRDNRTDVRGARVDSPDEPFGMSGGSIWTINANAKGVWSPENAKLIGIEYSWRTWKWLRGTQIQHWLAMLADDLPDLRACIMAAQNAAP